MENESPPLLSLSIKINSERIVDLIGKGKTRKLLEVFAYGLEIGKDLLNRTEKGLTMKETHGKLDSIKIRNFFYLKIAQRERKDKPQNRNLYLQHIYLTRELYWHI